MGSMLKALRRTVTGARWLKKLWAFETEKERAAYQRMNRKQRRALDRMASR